MFLSAWPVKSGRMDHARRSVTEHDRTVPTNVGRRKSWGDWRCRRPAPSRAARGRRCGGGIKLTRIQNDKHGGEQLGSRDHMGGRGPALE